MRRRNLAAIDDEERRVVDPVLALGSTVEKEFQGAVLRAPENCYMTSSGEQTRINLVFDGFSGISNDTVIKLSQIFGGVSSFSFENGTLSFFVPVRQHHNSVTFSEFFWWLIWILALLSIEILCDRYTGNFSWLKTTALSRRG